MLNHPRKEYKKVYIYKTESLSYTAEVNTIHNNISMNID